MARHSLSSSGVLSPPFSIEALVRADFNARNGLRAAAFFARIASLIFSDKVSTKVLIIEKLIRQLANEILNSYRMAGKKNR